MREFFQYNWDKDMKSYATNLLAYYCMPTLLKLKPSSIVNVRKQSAKAKRTLIQGIEIEISPFHSRYYILYEDEDMLILFIYNQELLYNVLNSNENKRYLCSLGYLFNERLENKKGITSETITNDTFQNTNSGMVETDTVKEIATEKGITFEKSIASEKGIEKSIAFENGVEKSIASEKGIDTLIGNRNRKESEVEIIFETTSVNVTENKVEDIIEDTIAKLKQRYHEYRSKKIGFPHEIGIILGYPLPDVEGFVQNNGKNYLLCGCWKVYHDADYAKKTFEKYYRVRDKAMKVLEEGKNLSEIIRANECSEKYI